MKWLSTHKGTKKESYIREKIVIYAENEIGTIVNNKNMIQVKKIWAFLSLSAFTIYILIFPVLNLVLTYDYRLKFGNVNGKHMFKKNI